MLSDYSRRFIQSVLWLLLALSYPVFAAQTIVFFDDFERFSSMMNSNDDDSKR